MNSVDKQSISPNDLQAEVERLLSLPLRSWPEQPTRVRPLPKAALGGIRLLALLSGALLLNLFIWFFNPDIRGVAWLFWPLAVAWILRGLCLALEWGNYCFLKVEPERKPARKWTVDILTTACPGEPREMIVRTLRAMGSVRLPHENFLCDEGDDPILKEVCRRLGVHHVTRTVKKDAKAGNINNALNTRCHGEIAVVLDPDHEPSPYMLERTLGYFEDPDVGFVQTVQPYGNQHESTAAKGAAEQTYLFYGPMMLGMHGLGTTQAIGANCIFRRAALDSIGGHAAGLAEDMHTAMRIYAAGWRSVYVPEMLTRGLVPSTLGAFFKQQIKWSCGSFDLLYQVYPKLFKNFTWAQRWHYLLAPVTFLKGLIVLIEVLIPILALLTWQVPIEVGVLEFLTYFVPVVATGYMLRQLVQRWVLEPHEHGLHWLGGLLATGTWWPYLNGFLCACARIKVPYIPTPKDNELVDEWRVVMPNIFFGLASFAAAGWGLSQDRTVYTLLMASFAIFNGFQLFYVSALGQRKTAARLRALRFPQSIGRMLSRTGAHHTHFRTQIYSHLREKTFRHTFLLCVIIFNLFVVVDYKNSQDAPPTDLTLLSEMKETGGFYWGAWQEQRPAGANVVPEAIAWGSLPDGEHTTQRNYPLWQIIPPAELDWSEVAAGSADDWFRQLAAKLAADDRPGFITIGPVDLIAGDGDAFVRAWQRVYQLFDTLGVNHLAWTWQVDSQATGAPFPEEAFIDWLLVSFPSTEKMELVYRDLRPGFSTLLRPVMVQVETPGARVEDDVRALSMLRWNEEIAGLLIGDASFPLNLKNPESWTKIAEGMSERPLAKWIDPPDAPKASGFPVRIPGSRGEWSLLANGEPIFVRGVSYNIGHDWRDHGAVLSRRQIRKDFEKIKALGANTIRRYGLSQYDFNLLRELELNGDIHLLHGFYFSPEVDYLLDRGQRDNYEEEVLTTVESRREHPAILAWGLGNETWGLLKHHFSKPYLTHVRRAHAQWVGELAEKVRTLDSEHPTFITHEATKELPAALLDFGRWAPALDFTSVNVFTEASFVSLPEQFAVFAPEHPYLISEFGPEGYWYGGPHVDQHGLATEDDSFTKASYYSRRYTEYIESQAGHCIGGVAYCWQDRFEGTATWFGMTDEEGRPKEAYHALREIWTGTPKPPMAQVLELTAEQEVVAPGEMVYCQVKCSIPDGEKATVRWRLLDRSFRERGEIHPLDHDQHVMVQLPQGPSDWYRLHVSVETAAGVADASIRLISWEPPQPSVEDSFANQ